MQYSTSTTFGFERECGECHKMIPSDIYMHHFTIAGKSINVCQDCAQVTMEENEATGESAYVIKIKDTYERAHLINSIEDVAMDDDLYYLGYVCFGHLPEMNIEAYEKKLGEYYMYERLWAFIKDNEVVITYDQGNGWCGVRLVTDYETFINGKANLLNNVA